MKTSPTKSLPYARNVAPDQAELPTESEKDPFAKFGSAAWADSMGRKLAQADMKKVARAEELTAVGVAAGEALAKTAGGMGSAALSFLKAHPGATIGAGLGLAHGLASGGIGTGLVEGATGAGLGHGVQAGVGAAMAHPELGEKLRAAKDRIMGAVGKGAAPATASAAAPVKTLMGVAPQKTMMGVAPPADGKTALAAMRDEFQKEAFGAALASLASKAIPAVTSFIKANPLKAGMGAASAVGNFVQSRQQGQGLGSSLLSGATGAASAAL